MPRQRSPNRDKAFEIYKEHGGNITNREIANILGENEKKVAVWKQRDKWDNVVQHKNKSCTTNKKNNIKITGKEIKESEIESPELTEKQRLFCLYYIKSFNATMAAIKAGYSPDRAHVTGSELVRNRKVAAEIRRLKGTMQEELFVDAMDVFEKYIKIAFSDITDYLSFGQRDVQVMGPFGPLFEGKGKDKKPIMKTVNYVDLRESTQIDGTIINEVSQGKDGIKIKLADKMKALDKLAEYFDLFPDKFKRRIEEEKLKLEQSKVNGPEGSQDEDDGFIDALEGKVTEAWKDET